MGFWSRIQHRVLRFGRMGRTEMKRHVVKAILTDVQFWVPFIVLALGVALLAYLH